MGIGAEITDKHARWWSDAIHKLTLFYSFSRARIPPWDSEKRYLELDRFLARRRRRLHFEKIMV